MKLLVTGSRKCQAGDYSTFKEWLETLLEKHNLTVTTMLHGGAVGADQFANTWAKHNNVPVIKIIRPDYTVHAPKYAPIARNIELVEECDYCVAVYKFEKKGGTAFTAKYANDRGKLLAELELDFTDQIKLI